MFSRFFGTANPYEALNGTCLASCSVAGCSKHDCAAVGDMCMSTLLLLAAFVASHSVAGWPCKTGVSCLARCRLGQRRHCHPTASNSAALRIGVHLRLVPGQIRLRIKLSLVQGWHPALRAWQPPLSWTLATPARYGDPCFCSALLTQGSVSPVLA